MSPGESGKDGMLAQELLCQIVAYKSRSNNICGTDLANSAHGYTIVSYFNRLFHKLIADKSQYQTWSKKPLQAQGETRTACLHSAPCLPPVRRSWRIFVNCKLHGTLYATRGRMRFPLNQCLQSDLIVTYNAASVGFG
jgi:hypothetical protein